MTADRQEEKSAKPATVRQKARESADKPIVVFGRPMRREELFRLIGLIGFFALMALVVVLL